MDGISARKRSERLVVLAGSLLVGTAVAFLLIRLAAPVFLQWLPDVAGIYDTCPLCFLLSGSILLLSRCQEQVWCRRGRVVAAVLLLLLSAYSWGVYLQWWPALGRSYSAPNSALAFGLGAAAILLLQQSRQRALLVGLTALIMCVLATLGFIGLVLHFDPIFGWSMGRHMTGYTASAILLFALGLAAIVWHEEQAQPNTSVQRLVLLVVGVLTSTIMIVAAVVYVVALTHLQWHAEENIQLILHEQGEHLQIQLERARRKHQLLEVRLQGAHSQEAVRAILEETEGFHYISVRDGEDAQAIGTPLLHHEVVLPLGTTPPGLIYQFGDDFYLQLKSLTNDRTLTTELVLGISNVLVPKRQIGQIGVLYLCVPNTSNAEHDIRCTLLQEENRSQSYALVSDVLRSAGGGQRGVGLYRDANKREVFIAYESLFGLILAVQVDAAELYDGVNRDLRLSLPFLLLLLFASGGMVVWRLLPLAQALRLSDQRFRDLVESSSDWVWEGDAQAVFTYSSPTIKLLLGYEPDEVIGKTPFDLMPHDEANRVRAIIQDIVKSGRPFNRMENALRHKNGRLVTLEISGVPFFDQHGDLVGFRGMSRDISERKKIEERLARSEAHYRLLAENANDLISLHDQDRRYIYVSPACRKLLGYEPHELLMHDVYEFIHPDEHGVARQVHEVIRSGSSQARFVGRLRQKDGGYIYVETWLSVIPHGESGEPEVLAVSRDVTSQQRQEGALRSSEQLHRSIVSALAEGVVVQDINGNIISANDAACSILGRSHDQMLGLDSAASTWSVIHEDGTEFPGEDHPAMITLRTGVPYRGCVMGVMRPDGTRVWISVNTEPLPGAVGEGLSGVISSFADISSRRKAEQALMVSRERLRALSIHLQQLQEEERTVLARELHDELGSVMTALKMDMTWLRANLSERDANADMKMDNMSKLVDGAVATVRRIVTDLRPTVLDDLGLWAALEWQLNEFARYSGLMVKRDIHCPDTQIPADMGLAVFRVMQEALTNVAKHARASEVRVDFWVDNERLHMLIEDNGVGMSEGRADDVTSHGIRSMEERMMQFGGEMEIHSGEGEGTLLYMWLPLN